MAAPVNADITYYPGTNNVTAAVYNVPTDDVTAIGGALDVTAGELVETQLNLLFDGTPTDVEGGSDITHHMIFYRRNDEGGGGSIVTPNYHLRNGMILNAAGTISIAALAGADVGKKMRLIGYSGASVVDPPELVTLVAGTAVSVNSYDAGEFWRAELLEADGVTPSTANNPIDISRGATQLARIRIGHEMATAEYELAIATALNTTLSAANRLAAPTGITGFSRAIKFPGNDSSIALAADLTDGDSIGVCLRKTLRAGLLPPLIGYVNIRHALEGIATA